MEAGKKLDDYEHQGVGPSSLSSTAAGRWSPTKEQIDLLEELYKQGLRTPSADQIQQITLKLKMYGHIEGKNVFYWFQNHKARQRQKQKQQSIIFINPFLHRQPTYDPASPNVLYSNPYYHEYHQNPNYMRPAAFPGISTFSPRTTSKLDGMHVNGILSGDVNEAGFIIYPTTTTTSPTTTTTTKRSHETLELFPVHPTGVLEKQENKFITYSSIERNSSDLSNNSSDKSCIEESTTTTDHDHLFFDFFADQKDY